MPLQEPLLYPDDYDEAPEDNTDAFLHLESLVRTRMYENVDSNSDNGLDYPAQMEYVTRVGALAQVYGIPGIVFDADNNNFNYEFQRFVEAVDYQTTQISALRAKAKRRKSVTLSDSDKRKIAHHVAAIRAALEKSEVHERTRKAILARLADLEAEIAKARSAPGAILVAAALALSVTADADQLSDTVTSAATAIIKIIGQSRLTADIEQQNRLPEPPKQIPAPTNFKRKSNGSTYEDLDDDIPF